MGDEKGIVFAFTLFLVIGLMIGSCLGVIVERSRWESWALENGHAHYDSKTGEFVLEGSGDD